MTHYRARITLERIEPHTDSNNYPREQATSIANIEVTGTTPAKALAQAAQHVSHLSSWHHQAEQGEHIWLGDLASFTFTTEPGMGGDDTPILEHRCGWRTDLTNQLLGNVIAERALQHRKDGCLPQAEKAAPCRPNAGTPRDRSLT